MMNKIQEQDIKAFAEHFALYECLRDKQILITGATGLLGSCLLRCLQALNSSYHLNINITAVVRNKEKAESMFGCADERLHYYVFDFSEKRVFCPDEKPDYIFHFASPTASKFFVECPVETIKTGLQGTEMILEYAKEHPLDSVVFASSLEVYGTVFDDAEPLTEEKQGYLNPMEVRSGYPLAKRMSECLCKSYREEYSVPVKIARLAQTFGAGISKDDNRVFAQFARSVINNKNIVLHTTGELSRCYCYTMDAIEALIYISIKGKDGEAYNVANEDTYISVIDMARFLCKEFNPNISPVIELKEGMGYSPTTKLRLDTQKVKDLGWKPKYDLRSMFHHLIMSIKE
jgi:nucleoside-diphosphate-sugar epimerase